MQLPQIGLHHARVQRVLEIQRNTAPNPERLLVAEGLWAHDLVLQAETPIHTFLWCPELARTEDVHGRAARASERAHASYEISAKTLTRISERERPDGLLSLVALPSADPQRLQVRDDALVLAADAIESPGNLGTLIRTLDACAADCLLLTNRRTRLTHPKVFRASQGRVLTLPVLDLERPETAIAWLRRHRFEILLADTSADATYRSLDYKRGRTAFVIGAEKYGIHPDWQAAPARRVRIPMLGTVDSLNVAIAASILLFEARAQKQRW